MQPTSINPSSSYYIHMSMMRSTGLSYKITPAREVYLRQNKLFHDAALSKFYFSELTGPGFTYQVHREEVLAPDEKIFVDLFFILSKWTTYTWELAHGTQQGTGTRGYGQGERVGKVRVDRSSVPDVVHGVRRMGPEGRLGVYIIISVLSLY